jgi:hydroxymethylpyrimidine pyrophosphatase-like HAD family hydrolase
VKLAALAIDYDGTVAVEGVFDGEVRRAIADARRRGIAVLLVTGRRLADLLKVVGDLSCFDVVVAENGAVLEFPSTGRHVVLGHPPSHLFIQELQRRGVPLVVGESVVETDAGSAALALDVLRQLEQPLILAFNRGRLMVLPQAIGKSTGLRHALSALRLSIHNAIGIGDAENDHDLLDACEVGAAVAWGSRALRAVADEIIAGTGPPAVAGYIRRVVAQPRLRAAQMGRRRLLLGHEHDGQPVSLAVRGRTILVTGEPGTGKSWLAGLLCEQLILQGYCVCILDPEGDYRSLEMLPGVITLGGDDPPPSARELVKALRHPDVSLIVDLSKVSHRRKIEYLSTLLPLLIAWRRRTGLPHKILLDEAHYYLGGSDGGRLIDLQLAGYILVTYRVSALSSSIQTCADNVVMVTRETDAREASTLLRMCHPSAAGVATTVFGDLATNEAALLPGAEESGGAMRRFRLAPRLTSHVRHQTKYLDMPVMDHHAFVFADGGRSDRVRTLKEFVGIIAALSEDRLRPYLERHDFSNWLGDVFRDNSLAIHIRQLEQRIEKERGTDIAAGIVQAIRARYETACEQAELVSPAPSRTPSGAAEAASSAV